MNEKGLSSIFIILALILVIGIATGAYYFGKSQSVKPVTQNSVVTSQTPQPTVSSTPDETANWKVYTEILSDYSIKYPPTSKPGSTTILLFNNLESNFISFTEFLDRSTLKYFQAGQFTLPYQQPSITVLKANGKDLQQSFDYFKQAVQDNQTSIEDTQNVKFKGMNAITFKSKVNVRRNTNQLFLTNIFTVQNDKIYIFSYAPDADGKVKKVFDQTISTVNFVKPSDDNTPENVVHNFYKWYLGCISNCSAGNSPYATSSIEKNLRTKGHGFFCVEPTNNITVDSVPAQGNQVEAITHLSYSESGVVDVAIKLVLINDQWKIDDAICPQTFP